MTKKNQFQLLKQPRFLPYFMVQFLGALNDNIFKTALLMLIAMTFATQFPHKANLLNNLGAGAFIFPFFLFAATAGQLADKYEKRKLIHMIKFAEILIALLIGVGFYLGNFIFLLSILFLLGTQAAFFSPVKYSILPQYLFSEELIGGNGLVEAGTFIAILLGTIIGGVLIADKALGPSYIFGTVLLFAICGWLISLRIPKAHFNSQNHQLKINWDPFSQTFYTLKASIQQPTLFITMVAISWFWFFGSILITQIPNYTELHLGGGATVMTLLLTAASLGIGLGSLLCERLSKSQEGIGLVPIGALGITLFTADLSVAHGPLPTLPVNAFIFIQSWPHCHILIDILLIGLFCGFYSVPLYVMLQNRSSLENRSQVIAANNIVNALFMTLASFIAIILLRVGLSIPQLFLVVSLMNAAVAFTIFKYVPEFLIPFKKIIKPFISTNE